MAPFVPGFQTLLLVVAAAACASAAAPSNGQKPHVVMVVVDDLGYNDVGFRSHQIKTPTIDDLAANGLVLSRYYVQDVCSPSRSTFMSGRYAMHHGVVDWIPPRSSYGLPLNETTLADKMLEAGYDTHAIGKWHMGFYKWAYTPTFRGFNSFYGFYSGGEDYFDHRSDNAYDFHRDPSPHCGAGCSQPAWDANGNYSTILFAEEAVRRVNTHDKSKPLFLYLAFQAVHAPAEVPDYYREMYNTTIPDPQRRTFAGMLTCLDEGLGNLTNALKAQGMYDNTLWVFTTDNGGPIVGGDSVGAQNWPFRGGKHSVYEGGVRGTAVIRPPPGVFTRTGAEYSNLMHGADWLPTLCDAVGVKPNTTNPLDGVSHWQAMVNFRNATLRTEVVLGNSTDLCGPNKNCGFAYRDQQYKFLRNTGGTPYTWAMPTNVTGGHCNSWIGMCFPGNDLRNQSTEDAGQCCGLCEQDNDCKGFTFNSGTCFLKKTLELDSALNDTACTSGVPSVIGEPPYVEPSSAQQKDGGLLFDIESDPHEINEIGPAHPDVVQKMQSRLDEILQSFTEAHDDPDCPFTHWRHTPQGDVMEPWC